jgi:hypothetical protein
MSDLAIETINKYVGIQPSYAMHEERSHSANEIPFLVEKGTSLYRIYPFI